MFLNFFSKTEAGHVLKMFLQFWLISASRSYKLGSYKKKKRVDAPGVDRYTATMFLGILGHFERSPLMEMRGRI